MAKNAPPAAGRGRPKGTPNKTTAIVKEGLLLAYEGIGGVEALTQWGKDNPTEFYKLLAKLLPHEVTGKDGAPLIPNQVWQFGTRTVEF